MSDNFEGWLTDGDEVDFVPMTRCKSTMSAISAKSKVSFAKDVNYYDEDPEGKEGSKTLGAKIRKSFKMRRPGSDGTNINFTSKQPGFGIIHFITLKIIFWDILISVGDVASDFMQGFSLIMTPGHMIYGWVTIGINWLPGFTAALHLVSMYRGDLGVKKTFTYCFLLVLLYPIVPVVAFLALLWHNQADLDNRKKMEKFRTAEYRAMISHAIAGGIESPVQFVLQIWLILNGIRPLPWYEYGSITITDWKGNAIYLPTTSTISIAFSLLSMLKAVIEFNILKVHIQDLTNWSRTLDFCVLIFDHLPYLSVSTFFRVVSIAFMVTYFHTFGFIPVFLYLFCNLVYGFNNFDLSNVPLWLVSSIATFFPVCMTTAKVSSRNRAKIVNLQYNSFKSQAILSFFCYGPALLAMVGIINFYDGYNYDGHIILDNLAFNLNVGFVLFMGLVSITLSFNPSFNKMSRSIYRYLNPSFTKQVVTDKIERESKFLTEEMMNSVLTHPPPPSSAESSSNFEKGNRIHILPPNKICNIIRNILIVLFIFVPIVAANVLMVLTQRSYGYVYFYSNDSHIVALKGIYLNGPQEYVHGKLSYYHQSSKDQWSNTHSESFHKRVARIQRPEWDSSLPYGILSNSSAIIILDDAPYRPSSPIPVVTSGYSKMPILLLQTSERLRLPEYMEDIYLTFDPYAVPFPRWSCDINSTSEKCINLKINISTRAIEGNQYRKKDCFWGNKPCVGFDNKLERMGECEGPDIPLCIRDNFFEFPTRRENESDFDLGISPSNCRSNYFDIKNSNCHIWSKWLKWKFKKMISNEFEGHVRIERARYCVDKLETRSCIFRELESVNCCDPPRGNCDNNPKNVLPRC